MWSHVFVAAPHPFDGKIHFRSDQVINNHTISSCLALPCHGRYLSQEPLSVLILCLSNDPAGLARPISMLIACQLLSVCADHTVSGGSETNCQLTKLGNSRSHMIAQCRRRQIHIFVRLQDGQGNLQLHWNFSFCALVVSTVVWHKRAAHGKSFVHNSNVDSQASNLTTLRATHGLISRQRGIFLGRQTLHSVLKPCSHTLSIYKTISNDSAWHGMCSTAHLSFPWYIGTGRERQTDRERERERERGWFRDICQVLLKALDHEHINSVTVCM